MKKFLINGIEFDLYNKSYTMGILNITPDSFSDGGNYIETEEAIKRAIRIAKKGDIVLVTGMGHEKFRIIEGKKVPWSDAEVVLNA
jgi:UDP-N-acetylmuramyl tripeptide synthase